jgi:predicted alpha/beta superfamily hydrolase
MAVPPLVRSLLFCFAACLAVAAPVTVPRSKQYDITSRINRQSYRILVSTPFQPDPSAAYPVFYILDGNQYFATASDAVTRQALAKTIAPAIVVGIGYPTDDPADVVRRRMFDLTPSVSNAPEDAAIKTGGADDFLRVLDEEIKPLVASHYKIDRTKQIIFGHSVGGLTVLRALFRNPGAFSAYIASSPSIWWNNREVLADEESFSKRARAGELHLKILITSAEGEQAPQDPVRMIDNASELAARLTQLNPANVQVQRVIFPGEIHVTVSQASLTRALRFALGLN